MFDPGTRPGGLLISQIYLFGEGPGRHRIQWWAECLLGFGVNGEQKNGLFFGDDIIDDTATAFFLFGAGYAIFRRQCQDGVPPAPGIRPGEDLVPAMNSWPGLHSSAPFPEGIILSFSFPS